MNTKECLSANSINKLSQRVFLLNDYYKLQEKEIARIIDLKSQFSIEHSNENGFAFNRLNRYTKGIQNRYNFMDFIGLRSKESLSNTFDTEKTTFPRYDNNGVTDDYKATIEYDFLNEYKKALIDLIQNFIKDNFLEKKDNVIQFYNLNKFIDFDKALHSNDIHTLVNYLNEWWYNQSDNNDYHKASIEEYCQNKLKNYKQVKIKEKKNEYNQVLLDFVKDQFHNMKTVSYWKIKFGQPDGYYAPFDNGRFDKTKLFTLLVYIDTYYRKDLSPEEKFTAPLEERIPFELSNYNHTKLPFNIKIYDNNSLEFRFENNDMKNKPLSKQEITQKRDLYYERLQELFQKVQNGDLNQSNIIFE